MGNKNSKKNDFDLNTLAKNPQSIKHNLKIYWEEIETSATKPINRNFTSFCAVDKKLYLYGGKDIEEKRLSDFWCYDTEMNQWIEIEAKNPPKQSVSGGYMFHFDDKLYVYGGVNETGEPNKTMIVYHIKTNEFELVDCPIGSYCSTCWVYRNIFYVYMGDGCPELNGSTFYKYDLIKKTWKVDGARGYTGKVTGGNSAALVGKYAYFIGQDQIEYIKNYMWRFDCETNDVELVAHKGLVPYGRDGGVAAAKQYIFIVGGQGGNSYERTHCTVVFDMTNNTFLEIYPDTEKIKEYFMSKVNLPYARSCQSIIFSQSHLWSFGGWANSEKFNDIQKFRFATLEDWSRQNHVYWPSDFKKIVLCLYLLHKQKRVKANHLALCPKPLIEMILSFLSVDYQTLLGDLEVEQKHI